MKTLVMDENAVYQVAARLIHILANLRGAEKYSEEKGGDNATQRVNHWQKEADTFLNEIANTYSEEPLTNEQK
jgi:hypothetical protein